LSRLKLFDRGEDRSDLESEWESLRRQRADATAELATLKGVLAERVASVQLRERELAEALERVEQREASLASTERRGARVDAVRARIAEARAARAARGDGKERTELEALRAELDRRAAELAAREKALAAPEATATHETSEPVPVSGEEASTEPGDGGGAPAAEQPSATARELSELEQTLAARASELDARESELAEREQTLTARASELEALAAELDARVHPEAPDEVVAAEDPSAADEQARLEATLEELREAERAFARTHSELAARSDALAEREAALAARERRVSAHEALATPDLDALEARIRRLEHGSRGRRASTQTFSDGLRSLEQRGLRPAPPDEPLH
jgi:chromosome segregation ATPase